MARGRGCVTACSAPTWRWSSWSAALCWLIGWRDFLIVWAPAALLAGSAGIWLFYVQHQFEDAYWQSGDEWSYADAALRGSSYLKLPKVLQFFTGNIGLHHVHHLNARIPNYNLQRAHDSNPIFAGVPTLSFWDGLRADPIQALGRGSRPTRHVCPGAPRAVTAPPAWPPAGSRLAPAAITSSIVHHPRARRA